MLNLIAKDLLIQKKQVLFGFAYIFILIFAFQTFGQALFSAVAVAFTYMIIMTACAYEDKNNADIILNSLPVKREKIVGAKYLSIFVLFITGTLAYLLFTSIVRLAGLPVKIYSLTPESLVGGFAAVSLMMGIYFPVFFRIGYIKSKSIVFLMFFGFFFGFPYILSALKQNIGDFFGNNLSDFLNLQGNITIAAALIVLILLYLLVSYILSVKCYRKGEF